MVIISNIKWKYKEFKLGPSLIKLLSSKMKALNLLVKPTYDIEKKALIFNDVTDGRTFGSTIDNKIGMKSTDPRVKKTGRNYLLSKRPTERQYHGFFHSIDSTLDELGLSADVEIVSRGRGSVELRKGLTKYDRVPKQKSYPTDLKS